ncbi:MAG: glycosyltransferase, partial [Flavisolibacter sp.]
ELYKKDYHLVLAGHVSIRVTKLEVLLKKLPAAAQKKVHLFEQLEEDELMDFYHAAEVFVYPSKAEGFGLPPLEAAAMQVPVICSNTTAMKDFDFFGENLIDASNPALLAERLSEVLNKRPEQIKLQQIANEIALQYSWKLTAKRFHDLIIKHCKTPAT